MRCRHIVYSSFNLEHTVVKTRTMFNNNPICITTNLCIMNTACGSKSKKKPVRLTVLPANFFLLELVADKDTRKGYTHG